MLTYNNPRQPHAVGPGAVYTPLQQHAAASDSEPDEGAAAVHGTASLMVGGGFKPFGVGRARPAPGSGGSGGNGRRNGDGAVPLLQLEEGDGGPAGAGGAADLREEGGGDGPLLALAPLSSLAGAGGGSVAMNQAPMWSCVAVLANNMMGAGAWVCGGCV